jgi:chorismate-pyruvate lyase
MPPGEDVQKALAPLADRYAAARRRLPEAELVTGRSVPQPYRRLLVHRRDMTSTLENFHSVQIHLRVLSRVRKQDLYRREVVLAADGTNAPVEFGVITVHLDALSPRARRLVLAARRPLGAILHLCGVVYTSRPSAFFKLRPDATISRALGVSRRTTLYGRCNELRDRDGRPIAECVEILPPA